MAEPAVPVDDPNRELPAQTAETNSNPRLNDTAEAIGGAVGSAVDTVRRLPERLQEMKERFTVIRGRLQEDAATTATEWKETARDKAAQARNRAAQLSHDYPLHVIAGVAGVGFVLGVALRIWRSRNA